VLEAKKPASPRLPSFPILLPRASIPLPFYLFLFRLSPHPHERIDEIVDRLPLIDHAVKHEQAECGYPQMWRDRRKRKRPLSRGASTQCAPMLMAPCSYCSLPKRIEPLASGSLVAEKFDPSAETNRLRLEYARLIGEPRGYEQCARWA
jgi:hypothetical protein